MVKLNIFTIADKGYWKYIPTLALSALMYNEDCHCEIMVKGYDEWVSSNQRGMDVLQQRYPNLTIRPVNEFWYDRFKGTTSNWVRFVEEPKVKADYTYVCDVDFIFCKGILEDHLPIFAEMGLCYSNIIREGTDKLTGCYMVKTKEWYDNMRDVIKAFAVRPEYYYYPVTSDEELLYKLVEASGMSLPDRKYKGAEYRPLKSVIHCSPNRSTSGWGIEDWKMPSMYSICSELRKMGIKATHMEELWIAK